MNREELVAKNRLGKTVFNNEHIESNFTNEDLSNLTFNKCCIVGDFSGANLTNTVFTECNLKTCIFKYANINEAQFSSNLLEATDFSFVQYENLIFTQNFAYSLTVNLDNINILKLNETLGFNIYEVE
ncbi:hypothetical protein AN1V17_16470 [Vallitalea sediminicola]